MDRIKILGRESCFYFSFKILISNINSYRRSQNSKWVNKVRTFIITIFYSHKRNGHNEDARKDIIIQI